MLKLLPSLIEALLHQPEVRCGHYRQLRKANLGDLKFHKLFHPNKGKITEKHIMSVLTEAKLGNNRAKQEKSGHI